jgi:hypothetical protein
LHADKYAKLAEAYNSDRDDLKMFVCNHQLYADAGVATNQPSDFNELSPLEFCQTMDYINLHYQDAKRNCTKSGSHNQFAACTSALVLICSCMMRIGQPMMHYVPNDGISHV